jgi:hypothetical protein
VHFRWAAWQIERTGMRPERRAALVQALHATDTAYAQLATATTAGDQWAYDQARSAVVAGEAAVWDAAPPPR